MAKVEREKIIDFEFESGMRDVGVFKAKLVLKRRTAQLVTDIKYAKAKMLGGQRAASGGDELHFEVMATLANAVEPTPNPTPLNPSGWVNEILDPAIWYAIFGQWQDYQDSFSAGPDNAGNGEATV